MLEGEVLIHTFWFCSKFYLKRLHLFGAQFVFGDIRYDMVMCFVS